MAPGGHPLYEGAFPAGSCIVADIDRWHIVLESQQVRSTQCLAWASDERTWPRHEKLVARSRHATADIVNEGPLVRAESMDQQNMELVPRRLLSTPEDLERWQALHAYLPKFVQLGKQRSRQ
jgi:hypothetical protein